MKLAKRKHSTTAALNMTPMIDVVFLLLIFFMTVSQISQTHHQPVELPKLAGATDQEASVMTINVLQDGRIVLGDQLATTSDVLAAVSRELADLDDDPSRLTVVLRADERGTSRTVNDLVRALGQMQITRVRIAVQTPEG